MRTLAERPRGCFAISCPIRRTSPTWPSSVPHKTRNRKALPEAISPGRREMSYRTRTKELCAVEIGGTAQVTGLREACGGADAVQCRLGVAPDHIQKGRDALLVRRRARPYGPGRFLQAHIRKCLSLGEQARFFGHQLFDPLAIRLSLAFRHRPAPAHGERKGESDGPRTKTRRPQHKR